MPAICALGRRVPRNPNATFHHGKNVTPIITPKGRRHIQLVAIQDKLVTCDEAVDLRRWDDLGKTPGAPTPPMAVYHDIIVEVLRVDA